MPDAHTSGDCVKAQRGNDAWQNEDVIDWSHRSECKYLGTLWWTQLCTIDKSLNFTRCDTSSHWRSTYISCLKPRSNFLVSAAFRRRCNFVSRSLWCARQQYITVVDARSKEVTKAWTSVATLTLTPVIAGHVTVVGANKNWPSRPQTLNANQLPNLSQNVPWLLNFSFRSPFPNFTLKITKKSHNVCHTADNND